MRLTGTCVLVLSVFAFAMPAYAGNGNGKGNETGSDAAPGNSVNAPGHLKNEDAPPPAQAATPTTTSVTAPAEGVKPSNDTADDTHAQAQSNETKLYGNEQTAGQIAIDHGAPGNTVLHGPGNSQPHKAAPCAGGHERDVHALKGKHSAACGSNPSPTPAPQPSPTAGPAGREATPRETVAPPKTTTPSTSDPAPPAPDPKPVGGDAEPVAVEAQSALAGSEAPDGTLPFTGMTLWLVALVGMLLIATGTVLRQIRTAAVPVKSEHDRSDRARHAAGSSRTSVGGRSGR